MAGVLRDATPAERRRIGVAKRFVGSKWYKSSNTVCVYPKAKVETLADTYAAIRREQTAALARPSNYPLKGDGAATAYITRTASPVGWRNKWSAPQHYRSAAELSVALAEARYRDWLDERDASRATAAKLAAD
jgi:hypothetical protein